MDGGGLGVDVDGGCGAKVDTGVDPDVHGEGDNTSDVGLNEVEGRGRGWDGGGVNNAARASSISAVSKSA